MQMRNKRIALIITLGILVFGLYFNILYNRPTNWDDPGLLGNPQRYMPTLDNLKNILTITGFGTWQPVRDISYMIDHSISIDNLLIAIHLHNIALYFFLTLAVFLFLYELFVAFGNSADRAFTWAAISSIMFAVLPVHVECVAWIYARKEPLFGLFTMLSLWTFVRARTGHARYFAASAIFLVLAVLSKPTALVVPAAMLVIDIALQLHNPERAYFKRRLTFFAATLVLVIPLSYWLVRMLNSAGGVKPYHGGTALSNLLAVSQIMIEYVRLYCFNFHYVADYPIRLYTSTSDWQSWMYILLNVSLIAAAAVSLIKRHYILPIFIAWHYIFVLPVSHIFPISQTLADRYAFMSSLSWCVLLGYILTAVGYKHLNYRRLSPNLPMLAAAAAVVLIASAYSMMSFKQTFVWRDSKSLWENTISRFSNSNPANVNLSVVYISEGKLEEAQKLCVNAIKEMPYDYYAISNLALAQMLMRQYDNAIHNYYAVLALKPDMEKPKLGIANCYWEKGDWKSTYYAYLEVIKSGFTLEDTAYAGLTYSRMAFCAYKIGKRAESEIFINKAATIADRHPESLTTLIDVATTMGRRDIAMKSYRHLYSVLTDPSSRQIVRERMEKYGSE